MKKRLRKLLIPPFAATLLLSSYGCGFFGGLQSSSATQDSAPSEKLDAKKIKNAVPRVEAKSRGGNRSPYTVFGQQYQVLPSAAGFVEKGTASWYGKKFHGNKTSNGETYDMFEMTAAHKHLPLPTYVKVKNLRNNKEIIVRVNDRGPFHGDRVIDLSYAAATKLDMLETGTAPVKVTAIDAKQWLAQRQNRLRDEKRASAAKRKPLIALANNKGEPAIIKEGSAASAVSSGAQAQAQAQNSTGLASSKQTQDSISVANDSVTASNAKVVVPSRWYVQMGVFSQLESAQKMQNSLLEQFKYANDAVNVVIHPSESSPQHYRVRVGPTETKTDARRIADSQTLAAYEKIFVVSD